MQQLSDEAVAISRQLYELQRSIPWFGQAAREQNICDLLSQLATMSEPKSLPCVVQFLFFPSDNVQSLARRTVGKIFSIIAPYKLLELNEIFGSSYSGYAGERWDKLTSAELALVAGDVRDDGHSSVLSLACFHRNGYVRQAAVNSLAKVVDGSELRCLLIRQNDWVNPVAFDAQSAVADRINDAYVTHLVKCLQLIIHLKVLGRYDHGEIVSRVIEILLDEEHDEILRETLFSAVRDVRLEVVRFGLRQRGGHLKRIVGIGLMSEDPVIRLACCRHIPAVYDEEPLYRELNRLANDTFIPVRREALTIKAARFPMLAIETWQRALIDPSFSIRDLARFQLSKLNCPNTASFYRTLVASDPDSLAVVEGLTEMGDVTDVESFKHLINHRLPTRRSAGIRGLARVSGEAAIDDIIRALDDDKPAVVRAAIKSLNPLRESVPVRRLLELVLKSQKIFVQKKILSFIAEYGKWRSTSWLLQIASQTEGEIAMFAEDLVRRWFTSNRIWTRPSSVERAQIDAALEQSNRKISEQIFALVSADLART